jgi:tRNA(Arg) A34 adenosine deaminase TadA
LNEFAPVICLQCSCNYLGNFHFQWYRITFPSFKLEMSAERDPSLSLFASLQSSLLQNDVRPASAPLDYKNEKDFFFGTDVTLEPESNPDLGCRCRLSPELVNITRKVSKFYHVKVEFYDRSPLYARPFYAICPSPLGSAKIPAILIFVSSSGADILCQRISKTSSDDVHSAAPSAVPSAVANGFHAELAVLFQELFCYPENFEIFFAVLQQSAAKQGVIQISKMKEFFYKCFRSIDPSTPLILCHAQMFKDFQEFPSRTSEGSAWDVIKMHCLSDFQKADTVDNSAHPLSSFILWIVTHCRIMHDCRGALIIQNFLKGLPDSFSKMVDFLRILYEYRAWHYLVDDDFSKQTNQTQCLFEGNQHVFLFSLCSCQTRNAIHEFAKLQLESSFMTARWLRRNTGRSYKLWGHISEHEYDRCEVQKCASKSEKWRHMIYAYAIMALLWSEYNGNKEGPIGDYPDRRDSEIGRMLQPEVYKSLLEQMGSSAEQDDSSPQKFRDLIEKLKQAQFVFPSKQGEKPVDYHGHNIVALAVGKRGDILRVAYNHNTLFCSTVDHAEERLIDGLYKDPEAFVQKSHARIFDPNAAQKQIMEVEKHMQHISVYTSLEQCQQCAGKFHLALVPEVIFCQRDWEIQLLQEKLYEQHHKCRPVPASYFGFPPYEELAMSYHNYCAKIDASGENGVTFFQYGNVQDDPPVKGKKTMPYFLCSNDAQQIFRRGSIIFHKVLLLLFHEDQKNRPHFEVKDPETFGIAWFGLTDVDVTVTQDDAKNIIERYNLDVSDWVTGDGQTPGANANASTGEGQTPGEGTSTNTGAGANTGNGEKADVGRLQASDTSLSSNVASPDDGAAPSSMDHSSASKSCSFPPTNELRKDEDAIHIRHFRPSLKSKQNRLWQDELNSWRKRWTDNTFKQRCTLKFFFDRNAVIDELDIDRNIGPLGEIRSIYLGRASSGGTSLKGTFDVTFSNISAAKEVKGYFGNAAMTKSGKIFLKNESNVSLDLRQKIVTAANWLHLIREPDAFELFIPDDFNLPSGLETFFYKERESPAAARMERLYPGQTSKAIIKVLKCVNISSKRKIQKHCFGLPWITLPQSVHHPQLEDNLAVSYLSLISRIDVSEGELLDMLRKCVSRNALKELPPHYRLSSCKLTTCNSNKRNATSTLKYLHFVARSPTLETSYPAMDCMVMDWKLWNIKFKTPVVFDIKSIQSSVATLGTNKFCQPYPQCVFNFAFNIRSSESESGNGPFSIRWNPYAVQEKSGDRKMLFCLTIMMDTKLLNPAHKNVRILKSPPIYSPSQGSKLEKRKAQSELNFMVDENYSLFWIDKVPDETEHQLKIDENCIATMIVSDMLDKNIADIKQLWENWDHPETRFSLIMSKPLIGQRSQTELSNRERKCFSAQQYDFWGHDIRQIITCEMPKKQNGIAPCQKLSFDHFINMLKCAKEKNVFCFGIQGVSNDICHGIEFSSKLQTDRAELICQYCGIRTVVTGISLFCTSDESCIGHFTQERKRDDVVSFGKFVKEVTEFTDNRDYNEAGVSADCKTQAEAKVKPKVHASIETIVSLEKRLYLSMTVQSCLSLENVIKECDVSTLSDIVHSVMSFQPPRHLPRLYLTLRRDAFDDPAYISFCIDNLPDFKTSNVRIQIQNYGQGNLFFDRLANVSAPISSASMTSSVASLQESNLRLHGKISSEEGLRGIDVLPEGGVICANALRYFLEPEYFPESFLSDYLYTQTGGAEAKFVSRLCALPTIDFIIGKGSEGNEYCKLSVNSWNFEELQSNPLRKLLQSLKELQMQRFKLWVSQDKENRISAKKEQLHHSQGWYLHCDELQKRTTTVETILFANLVRVHKGAITRISQSKL